MSRGLGIIEGEILKVVASAEWKAAHPYWRGDEYLGYRHRSLARFLPHRHASDVHRALYSLLDKGYIEVTPYSEPMQVLGVDRELTDKGKEVSVDDLILSGPQHFGDVRRMATEHACLRRGW